MRIGVLGVGGIGGYFGARLAAAGNELHFVARGAHGEALAGSGLQLESPFGDLSLTGLSVSDRLESLADCDLIMHCTKMWEVEESGRSLAACLSDEALVVPFQNGVEAADLLAASLGDARVAQGIAYISAFIEAPGRIRHANKAHRLALGARQPDQADCLQAFCEIGTAAGFEAVMSKGLAVDLWRKMIVLTALAGATGLRRVPLGAIRRTPSGGILLKRLAEEALAVALAEGVAMPDDSVAKILGQLESFPDSMEASMAMDLRHGRRLELPWLNEAILRLAERHGLSVPTTVAVVAALQPFQEASRVRPDSLAQVLIAARDPKNPPAELPGPLTPGDLESAYGVQDAVATALGGRTAGYKVAATSKIAQEHLGLDGPLTGRLLVDRLYSSPASLPAAEHRFFVVEPEYAFTMGQNLPPRAEAYSEAEVAVAVTSLHPAFEIVSSAYGEAWREAGAAPLIADNAVHTAMVMGPPTRAWRDLDFNRRRVRLSVDGDLHSEGEGIRVLGGPLETLLWLMQHLAARGRGLQAGDVVTTGVVTDIAYITAGQRAEADFGELGQVSFLAS